MVPTRPLAALPRRGHPRPPYSRPPQLPASAAATAVQVYWSSESRTAGYEPKNGNWYTNPATGLAGTPYQLSRQADIPIGAASGSATIAADTNTKYQSILGVGSSLEESTIFNLSRMSAAGRDRALRTLVDPSAGGRLQRRPHHVRHQRLHLARLLHVRRRCGPTRRCRGFLHPARHRLQHHRHAPPGPRDQPEPEDLRQRLVRPAVDEDQQQHHRRQPQQHQHQHPRHVLPAGRAGVCRPGHPDLRPDAAERAAVLPGGLPRHAGERRPGAAAGQGAADRADQQRSRCHQDLGLRPQLQRGRVLRRGGPGQRLEPQRRLLLRRRHRLPRLRRRPVGDGHGEGELPRQGRPHDGAFRLGYPREPTASRSTSATPPPCTRAG